MKLKRNDVNEKTEKKYVGLCKEKEQEVIYRNGNENNC